ncbi:probable protein phosphatase 2C 54 [Amborella trichopoda]|uniref:probable protein phosphatase 2C 54 n=1 Tax=Amborella trichopoda TaxID=13333 RepID=UPI0005D3E547|nr:probable protein phosphatase 2C 54 [Amborella trichopoda]|eukprot:XP_011626451.1 probable protein phosphatase 2C 54 [Amborella trichopoda]
MCVEDSEKLMAETMGLCEEEVEEGRWPLPSSAVMDMEKNLHMNYCLANYTPMESICENTVAVGKTENQSLKYVPVIRSGEWSDIGSRLYMEDTHVCIADLAKKFGFTFLNGEAVSFYGVSH